MMPMHGQAGIADAASFVAMWTLMMVAMMLPSIARPLSRSRHPLVMTLGYAGVWAALGLLVHLAGAALAAATHHLALTRALPPAGGLAVLLAGALQFTPWKAHHLARARAARAPDEAPAPAAHRAPLESPVAALRRGLRLGVHCACSCAGPTAVLLALGAMDLRVMALVTVAVTAERLAPRGLLVARASGAVAIAAGLVLIATAWTITSE